MTRSTVRGSHALSTSHESRRQYAGTGGAIFAGTLLIIGSSLWILEGLAGIVKGNLVHRERELLDHHEREYLGWIHLVGGIIGLAAGFGVFSGAGWARWLGIFIGAISILVNFTFILFQPWWALTIIFIDLWVIHSLFVHRRLRD